MFFITLYFVLNQGTVKAKAFLTKLLLAWSFFLTIATFMLVIAFDMQSAELDRELRKQIENKYKGELVTVQKVALNYADAMMYTNKLYDKNEYGFTETYRYWREKVDSLWELDRKQSE